MNNRKHCLVIKRKRMHYTIRFMQVCGDVLDDADDRLENPNKYLFARKDC